MKTLSFITIIIAFTLIQYSFTSKLKMQDEIYIYYDELSLYYYDCCVDFPYYNCELLDYYCVDQQYLVFNTRTVPFRKTDKTKTPLDLAKKELKYLKTLLFRDPNFDLEHWRINHEKEVFNSPALHKLSLQTSLAKLEEQYKILSLIQ